MARICVVSDIHGNYPAMTAVLKEAGDCDEWWCAGDIVGYGPYPTECVRIVREMRMRCVAGNHDLGVAGKISTDEFNESARAAIAWTSSVIEIDASDYLSSLPLVMEPVEEINIFHGSLRNPVWDYITHPLEAIPTFDSSEFHIAFNGHSHVPVVFSLSGDGQIGSWIPDDMSILKLCDGMRYIVNAGSVGQPRDGDPRCCFLIFDSDEKTIIYRRVWYPVEKVQRKMEEARLPEPLIRRLSYGI